MEIWELVYPDGSLSGVKYDRESGDPIPSGLCFKVCEVYVTVGEDLLLGQRHPDKWSGLLWEASGGGVLMGESDRGAAARELFEELGIKAEENELVYLGRSMHGVAMVESFLLPLESEPRLTLQPSEVVGSRYVKFSDIEKIKDDLTPGTYERFNLYRERIVRG